MSADGVRVEFQILPDEFAAFVRWQVKRMPTLRWVSAGFVLEMAVGVLLIAASVNTGLGFVVLGIGLLQLLWWLRLRSSVPRRAWNSRSADLRGDQVLTFSELGVHVSTVNVDSMTRWELYESALRMGDLYLLKLNGGRAFRIIPQRAFGSPSDEQEFRRLVSKHLIADLTT